MALRIDSHHHFWDTANPDYDYYWMTDAFEVIKGKRGPNELRPWLTANGIDKTIVVQTIPSLRETKDFLAIAASTDFVAGVIGWVDLTDGKAADTLRELKAGKDGRYLAGIRHQVHDEEDAEWILRKDVQSGIAAVGRADLTYDLLPRTRELPACIKTVQAFPETRFVLDHIAKPNIKERQTEPWSARMKELAKFPNVWVKVSGMITEADWYSWKPEDLRPYIRNLLDWFGPERLIFGSDWPVCTLAGTYSQVCGAAAYALGPLGKSERESVFGGNAVKAYRLAL